MSCAPSASLDSGGACVLVARHASGTPCLWHAMLVACRACGTPYAGGTPCWWHAMLVRSALVDFGRGPCAQACVRWLGARPSPGLPSLWPLAHVRLPVLVKSWPLPEPVHPLHARAAWVWNQAHAPLARMCCLCAEPSPCRVRARGNFGLVRSCQPKPIMPSSWQSNTHALCAAVNSSR